jgi:hypothetical protein
VLVEGLPKPDELAVLSAPVAAGSLPAAPHAGKLAAARMHASPIEIVFALATFDLLNRERARRMPRDFLDKNGEKQALSELLDGGFVQGT